MQNLGGEQSELWEILATGQAQPEKNLPEKNLVGKNREEIWIGTKAQARNCKKPFLRALHSTNYN